MPPTGMAEDDVVAVETLRSSTDGAPVACEETLDTAESGRDDDDGGSVLRLLCADAASIMLLPSCTG